MIDVGFFDRVRGGIGVHDVLKGGVIKGEGLTGCSTFQITVCRGIWSDWITFGSVSGGLLRVGVCVMGVDSPVGWRGGSGGGIVLFELLDGHITQKFVDVGRKKDGSRRPSGGGSASARGSGRLPKCNGGDIRRPSEVGSVDLLEFLCWHVNATIGGTCGGVVLGIWVVMLVMR